MLGRDVVHVYGTEADPQQGDPVAAENLTAEQYDLARQQESPSGSESLEANLGNTVTVPVPPGGGDGFTKSNPQSLVFATFKKPQHATFIVQADGPGCYVTIRVTIAGRATFERQFPLPVCTVPRTLALYGRMIDVSVSAVTNTVPVHVVGALVTEEVEQLGELWATWVPFTDASGGVLSSQVRLVPTNAAEGQIQGGCLLGAQGFVNGDASTGYWIMFFDSYNAPAEGDAPLLAIGPVKGGQTFSFDRSLRPDIFFEIGLYYALSATGDTYTGVGEGPDARVDFDWGT